MANQIFCLSVLKTQTKVRGKRPEERFKNDNKLEREEGKKEEREGEKKASRSIILPHSGSSTSSISSEVISLQVWPVV